MTQQMFIAAFRAGILTLMALTAASASYAQQVTSGNTALGGGIIDGTPLGPDNVVDLVVMDDFLYAAPVPEPETYAMLLAGLGLIGAMSRRRKNP